MPDYPRPCSRCDELLERESFAVDRSKASGRKSHCKECDRQRRQRYYAAHKDEWYAERKAAREAAWEAELARLEEGHKLRVAASRREHEAAERRQAEWLRSIGFTPSS